ncbi:MAG: hypothetical protein IPF81_00800 [Bacteroidetes bacterium]|nr:hypothetical protein [Bacteroidota bacterium]
MKGDEGRGTRDVSAVGNFENFLFIKGDEGRETRDDTAILKHGVILFEAGRLSIEM